MSSHALAMRRKYANRSVSRQAQRGTLLLVAIALIVVIAGLVVSLAFLATANSASGGMAAASTSAYFEARSGLERTIATAAVPDLTQRQTCASLTGLSDVAVGAGTYSVTGSTTTYSATPATLAAAITATDTRIRLTSIAGYVADGGRVMIDRELIEYSATASTAAACSPAGTPCVVVSRRGADGSAASAHAGGTRVGQYQCNVTVAGAVPKLATAKARRNLSQAVQLQELWAAGTPGGTANNRPWLVRFQENVWNNFDTTAVTSNDTINAISMLSYADGFAVGTAGTVAACTRPLVMRWNGSTWPSINNCALNINRTLNTIHCVNANDCWMGGAAGTVAADRPWLLHWDGTAVNTVDTTALNRNEAINRVFCVSGSECYAGGTAGTAAAGDRPFLVRWNGTSWTTPFLNVANVVIFGLHCPAANDCWAVGGAGAVAAQRPFTMHWDGTSWTAANNTALNDNLQLNEVYCVASNDCWAVGNFGGVGLRPYLIHWNGSAWTLNNSGLNISSNLNGISCTRTNDCWAVGNAVAGVAIILHWDGSAWTQYNAGAAVDGRNLTWVKGIGPVGTPATNVAEVIQ